MVDLLKAIFLVAFFAILVTALGLYSAFFLSLLWLWFIVPLGVPAISVAHMWGIGLFKAVLFAGKASEMENKVWASILVLPPLATGIGYILKGFI